MARVEITEVEAIENFAAVLEKVKEGVEVAIQQGYRTIALITPVTGPGRPLDECIALAKKHSSGAILDEDFARDLENILAQR